jgi:heme/copper-type cytochrome/quinol oxidase subunit 2
MSLGNHPEAEVEQSILNIIIMILIFINTTVAVATLYFVTKLFHMHNVKDPSGQYAWMIPREWVELPKEISATQEKIVAALGEISVHNRQNGNLMEKLTNAVLEIKNPPKP